MLRRGEKICVAFSLIPCVSVMRAKIVMMLMGKRINYGDIYDH